MIHCRMCEPETVQYFQFDKEGSMYIFDAGAGCTGVPKMVKPGDKLIFPASSNVCDGHFDTSL